MELCANLFPISYFLFSRAERFYLAQIHAERGDHEKAIALYRSVLEADVSGYFTSIDPGILGYKAKHNLALSFMALGDYESAKGEWLSAIENSGRVELTFPLFEQAIKHSDAKTVKDLLAFIHRQTGYSEPWAKMVLESCEMVGIPPMPMLESALAFNPNNHGVRLVLARYLLRTGHGREAAEQFLMLQAAGAAEAAYALGLIALDSGQKDKAIAWLQRAHTLNPSHAETLARLNAIMGTQNQA